MFVARERPTASDQPQRRVPRGDQSTAHDTLTRAEARALSRSAPLTPAEFKAKRTVAATLVDPLPMLLESEHRERSQRQRPDVA